MKQNIVIFLSVLTALVGALSAGCTPSKPQNPPSQKNQAANNQVARAGEARDDSLENREDRAEGEPEREDSLNNRQSSADTRQNDR
jgi:hypothetical protein